MPDALPSRRSTRLQGYDYRNAGAYFITICTHERLHLFGTVVEDGMHLSAFGQTAVEHWHHLPQHFPQIEPDMFVAMPKHVHGIVVFIDDQRLDLTQIIGGYKSGVTRQINTHRSNSRTPVWQRSFHDRIIRNERELNLLREYIEYNPARWREDRFWNETIS
jgi:putative transposase